MFSRTSLSGHKGNVNCLHTLDNLLYSGSDDKTVRIWDIRTGKTEKCFTSCFGEPVDSICTANNNEFYVACGNQVFSFDLRNYEANQVIIKSPSSVVCNLEGDDNSINSMNINSAGSMLAVSDDSYKIGVYSINTENSSGADVGQCCYRQEYMLDDSNIHSSMISSLMFPTKHMKQSSICLISGGFDGVLSLWDIGKNHVIRANVLNFNTATVANGGGVQSTNSNQIVNPPYIHQLEPILHTGVACAIGDGSIGIVSAVVKDEQCKLKLHHRIENAHDGMVTSLTSLGSNTLCSSGIDGIIKIWDIQPGSGGSGKLNRRQRKKKFESDFPTHIETNCKGTIQHGAKVNMMVRKRSSIDAGSHKNDSPTNAELDATFFVADVTPVISVYTHRP